MKIRNVIKLLQGFDQEKPLMIVISSGMINCDGFLYSLASEEEILELNERSDGSDGVFLLTSEDCPDKIGEEDDEDE